MHFLQIVSVMMGLLGFFGKKDLTYRTFEKWVDTSLSADMPEGIGAFWACDEVFNNREQPLKWSSRQSWEKILAQMESHLKKYMKKGKYASLLSSKRGLGLGFVDGDLILL